MEQRFALLSEGHKPKICKLLFSQTARLSTKSTRGLLRADPVGAPPPEGASSTRAVHQFFEQHPGENLRLHPTELGAVGAVEAQPNGDHLIRQHPPTDVSLAASGERNLVHAFLRGHCAQCEDRSRDLPL